MRLPLATARDYYFVFFNIIAITLYFSAMGEFVSNSLHNELYSYTILVPLLSGIMLYSRRKEVFADVCSSPPAVGLMIFGLLLYAAWGNLRGSLNQNDHFSLITFSAITFWIGGFILFYGTRAFRKATFPLLFLFFAVPIPTLVLDKIVSVLQSCSAEAAFVLFKLGGVVFAREGYIFHLPGVSVEVANQCSGIRSSIVLVMLSAVLGNLFLRSNRGRVLLLVAVFPIAIFKNGLRIVTLSLLGAYVDIRILSSVIHRRGGIPFFVLGFLLLTSVLWLLRVKERKNSARIQDG